MRHTAPARTFGSAPMRAPARVRLAGSTPWRWASFGVITGALIATVVFAPAHWLAQGVWWATDARVQLQQAQGTVWAGSAQLVLSGGQGSQAQTTLPGRVHWTLHTQRLGVALALQADCCLRQEWVWVASPSLKGVTLRLSDLLPTQPLLWPSAMLAGLGTPWNTLQLQGTLALSTTALQVQWHSGQWQIDGAAFVQAQDMSTSLSTLAPIGTYHLTLKGGPQPTLDLATERGSLLLGGNGQWSKGQLRFRGEASAAPAHADALNNLLNIIGRREGARSIITVG
jgi:general secretion pathway protein N